MGRLKKKAKIAVDTQQLSPELARLAALEEDEEAAAEKSRTASVGSSGKNELLQETGKRKKKVAKKRRLSDSSAQAADAPKAKKKKRKTSDSTVGQPVGSDAASGQPASDGVQAQANITTSLSAEAYRETHKIKVRPGCPDPFQTWQDVQKGMGRFLRESLEDQGFKQPTPIQAQAWPILLRGEDLVGVSKTGSGKTCAFLLPALVRIGKRQVKAERNEDKVMARPSIVVVTPTRELAQQIEVEADKFADAVGARVVAIFGGVPKTEQLKALKRGVDILVTTPGRVLDFVTGNSTRELGPVISLKSCGYLVLDEADKMLDMGFEPDIRKVILHCMKAGSPEEVLQGTRRQTVFFTATWPKTVHQLAAYLTSPKAWQLRIGQSEKFQLTTESNVKQKVFVLSQMEKLERLKHIINGSLKQGETALVFAMTKKTCEMLEKELTWDPLSTGPVLAGWVKSIHGDKDQAERDKVLNTFREMTANPNNKHKGVLVATDVASRGLDIPGVALVVVYDMSDGRLKATDTGMEAYVHRIGRTGRAGKSGKAVAFFTPDDRGAKELCKMLQDGGQEVPPALKELAERNELFGDEARGKGKGKGRVSHRRPGRGSKGRGKRR